MADTVEEALAAIRADCGWAHEVLEVEIERLRALTAGRPPMRSEPRMSDERLAKLLDDYRDAVAECAERNDAESLHDQITARNRLDASLSSLIAENARLREDAARLDWLEEQGVQSIYLRDGRQINPASSVLRTAIDFVRNITRAARASQSSHPGDPRQ